MTMTASAREGVRVQDGYRGGYTGWVYRGSTYPASTPREEDPVPAKRARKPCRGWSGGDWVWARDPGAVGPAPTLRARSGSRPLPGAGPPLQPPPGQYRRELTSFYRNLVKTAECHQNVSKRPVIVPISKTGSRSHLLDF